MKSKSILFAILVTFTSMAAAEPTCKLAYAKLGKQKRHGVDAAAKVSEAALGLSALTFAGILAEAPGLKMIGPAGKIKTLRLGGILAAILLATAGEAVTLHRRAIYAEVIAQAIGETDAHEIGPATMALVEFLKAASTGRCLLKRGHVFYGFRLPTEPVARVASIFNQAEPTPTLVQDTLAWMNIIGLLCHAEVSPLNPSEFADRFAYALQTVSDRTAP